MKTNGYFMIGGLITGLVVGFLIFNKEPATISNIDPVVITQDLPPVTITQAPEIIYKNTTIYKDSIVYVVKWKERTIEVPIPTDTAAIVKAYLTINNYVFDTTANEVMVHEESAIFANRILTRSLTIKNERQCEETSLNGLSLGVMAGYHDFSVLAGYKYNKITYLGGYNIYENQFKAGVLIKIKSIKSWKRN